MKTLVVLFAGLVTANAFENLFDEESAFERSLAWAQTVSGVSRIDVFTSTKSAECAPVDFSLQSGTVELETVFESRWNSASLLQHIAVRSAGFDATVFGWADCPFYDNELTEKLLKMHTEYGAEYTFADGYPAGLTPEIIHPSSAVMLAELVKNEDSAITRDVLFAAMKKDINAFEIETLISPKDLRYLRLQCFCGTKRDTLMCSRLYAECAKNCSAKNICEIAEKSPLIQRTLPGFYAIQIASACRGSCTFCPYPAEYEKKHGINPVHSTAFMPFEQFSSLVERIAEFSEDAVISLSLWGDALLHPQLADFVAITLQNPALSLLIETDASELTKELAQNLAQIVEKAGERTNAQQPINWIIALDSASAEQYKKLHGFDSFEQVCSTVEMLELLFPTTVYPQFVRLKENETELEPFYRLWKEKSGRLIVQKYDWFSGLLEDKKVADLTPLVRNPCWHLRRDMNILIDGGVPLCRTGLLENLCGNAFIEPLKTIWERAQNAYAEHLNCRYAGICEKCDEYYTFNF